MNKTLLSDGQIRCVTRHENWLYVEGVHSLLGATAKEKHSNAQQFHRKHRHDPWALAAYQRKVDAAEISLLERFS